MHTSYYYLILSIVGLLICYFSIYIIETYRIGYFDEKPVGKTLNPIIYSFWVLGATMTFIGLINAYFFVVEKLGWKTHGAKVDLSYFTALKHEIKHALKKLGATVTNAL